MTDMPPPLRHRFAPRQSQTAAGPSRRGVIRSMAAGSILLPGILQSLLGDDAMAGSSVAAGPGGEVNPLAPRAPHFPGKAKRVIFMYMSGGVSHMDTFDPKPRLVADAGKPSANSPGARPYLRPMWDFNPGGTCG